MMEFWLMVNTITDWLVMILVVFCFYQGILFQTLINGK